MKLRHLFCRHKYVNLGRWTGKTRFMRLFDSYFDNIEYARQICMKCGKCREAMTDSSGKTRVIPMRHVDADNYVPKRWFNFLNSISEETFYKLYNGVPEDVTGDLMLQIMIGKQFSLEDIEALYQKYHQEPAEAEVEE